MNAEAPISTEQRPRWRRRLSVAARRSNIVELIEVGTVAALIIMATISFLIVRDRWVTDVLLSPPVVAMLLVANLVPAMALMVLVARRVALKRAANSPIGGRGRLHVRLVALFSVIAAVPTLLVVIFASLILQSGTNFWFSERSRGMLENAATIAKQAYQRERDRITLETVTMSGDVATILQEVPIDSPQFMEDFARQVYYRNLSEAVILNVTPDAGIQALALVNPYERPLEQVVTQEMIAALRAGRESVSVSSSAMLGAVTRLPIAQDTFLYTARINDPQVTEQIRRGEAVVADYRALLSRARTLQLRFNAALLVVSLLIVALTIWIALTLADRLVRPVGQLVDAAKRITAGDLSARVPQSKVNDEVGTLGNAFNRMASGLEGQTGALVTANRQLDSRRTLIEAVLSGVTAGVISVDDERRVRIINSSAEALLKTADNSAVGQKLADLAPELDRQLDTKAPEDVIQFASGGDPRTLAVKQVKVVGGHVITFDDITDQLLDQRRAAWSDVARRIAHEIKNPLTPIQLAAERLQRRYGSEITSDAPTFERLTGTIVRQVGDLRRMVDEFSSFARMPKPLFQEEAIVEIAKQALFLHEVAHPDISFTLEAPDPSPVLVCDRRQLGQALTNVVKNAVEAIQQKRESSGKSDPAEVAMAIRELDGHLILEVSDTGIGLPTERARLTEPYMTTRAKGTGLGLAIVKKIVEEHFGRIEFGDAPGGGTLVRLVFEVDTLARLGNGVSDNPEELRANG